MIRYTQRDALSVGFVRAVGLKDVESYNNISEDLLEHFSYTNDLRLLNIEYLEPDTYIKECDYCGELLVSRKMGNNSRMYSNKYVNENAEYPSTDDSCKKCLGKKNRIVFFKKHGVIKNVNAMETRAKNGHVPTSRQQIYLSNLLNAKLNPYFKNIGYIDIVLEDDKLVIEYDGSGHYLGTQFGKYTYEEKLELDYKRDLQLRLLGYKVIRIESKNDYLPTDEVILEKINDIKKYLNISEKEFFKWDIPSRKKDKSYGELREIKEEDLNR